MRITDAGSETLEAGEHWKAAKKPQLRLGFDDGHLVLEIPGASDPVPLAIVVCLDCSATTTAAAFPPMR